LKKKTDQAVKLYNQKRPHSNLNNLTPMAFEQLNKGLILKKQKMVIYKRDESSTKKSL